ncbi:hypothetical protein H6G97_16520 [Nostoc flagelliforme FACHB-838]|uniref:Transposase n=1 Tax=Nostoc flagelliforme FACHB-838 TaxID=2692904 RepID=A0ABR8DP01_9NOSO|nr:hypothetical protein [Nostoc flagelliforme]MBD2531100.1 hypothetical protein [Nostoc flagelliforme FACHB-838]
MPRLEFRHKDSLGKLSVKFTINAANQALIVYDARAQVAILYNNIVSRK